MKISRRVGIGGYQNTDDTVRMVGCQLWLCQFQAHPCPPPSSKHLTGCRSPNACQIHRWWEGMVGLGSDGAIIFVTHHETSDD